MYDLNSIKEWAPNVLAKLLPGTFSILGVSRISGGSINGTFKIDTNRDNFFLKVNDQPFAADMFEKETLGLNLLRQSTSLRVPEVIGTYSTNNHSFLVMEWIQANTRSHDYWRSLAEGLALIHQQSNSLFGLDHDNFIGSLPQSNSKHASWIDFFIKERLNAQIKLAQRQQLVDHSFLESFDSLVNKLDVLIPNELPALVHGDLWSGNILQDEVGAPVIIDPAVYYGNREMDIAFSKLFGGFAPSFYEAYNNALPMTPGFNERTDIYNLYPLLVHLNLFGKAYLGQIMAILTRFT